jgi:hypothetical protein
VECEEIWGEKAHAKVSYMKSTTKVVAPRKQPIETSTDDEGGSTFCPSPCPSDFSSANNESPVSRWLSRENSNKVADDDQDGEDVASQVQSSSKTSNSARFN